MIYCDKDEVIFTERGSAESFEGTVVGKVFDRPLQYVVRIPMDEERSRFVIADEKELKKKERKN